MPHTNNDANEPKSTGFEDIFHALDMKEEMEALTESFQQLAIQEAQPQEEQQTEPSQSPPSDHSFGSRRSTPLENEWFKKPWCPIDDSSLSSCLKVPCQCSVAYPRDLQHKLIRGRGDVNLRHLIFNQSYFARYSQLSAEREVVHGLKVWSIGGDVWYVKRLLFKGNNCWLSQEGLLEYLQSYESNYDGLFYDTPIKSAGKDPFDFALYWFLIDRGMDFLQAVLMGTMDPEPGNWFYEFPMRWYLE